MARYTNPTPQYFDGSGDPLPFGKLCFFRSGTNDQLTTYADSAQTIPNSNPVELDAAGRSPNIFYTGAARVILEDADGVQIWERDPVGGDSGESGQFEDYISDAIYSINDCVLGPDGKFYISIKNDNQGNDPTNQPSTFWSRIQFNEDWNASKTYGTGDRVIGSDNLEYVSLVASNSGNDPTVDSGTNWKKSSSADITYDNATSGLSATNVQGAIDEVVDSLEEFIFNPGTITVTPNNSTTREIVVYISDVGAQSITLDRDNFSVGTKCRVVRGDFGAGDITVSTNAGSIILPDGNSDTSHTMNSGAFAAIFTKEDATNFRVEIDIGTKG